jgi:TPR repeat protein
MSRRLCRYSRSAEKGNEQAQQALRRIKAEEDNDRERDTPLELLRQRAFDGNRHAMFQLGCRYYNGEREKEKEREREREKERERDREARKKDKSKDKVKEILPDAPRVVLQPFVDVESFVPTPCLPADSVDCDTPELKSPPPQGYEEALYWFTRAAMAGHAGAHNYCGVCYGAFPTCKLFNELICV